MKLSRLVTALCLGLAAVASAQTYTETGTKTETKYVTVDGEVIRYEPGKIIVIRGADNKEVTYTLLPKVTVPNDVQVGRRVVLYTEPGTGGSTVVTRVTTTTVSPEGNVKKTTEETRTTETKTDTKYVSVDGEVIRYEPGKVIVIRGADNKEVTYTLLPKVTVPKDVQVGRRVVLYTEPGTGGSTVVARVTTTTVSPEGNVKKTTEETRTKAGVSTKTTTTEISGTVQAYESGKTLTILRSDGSKVTYTLTGESTVPADLVIGKTVTIEPIDGSDVKVAKTVTYTIVRE